MTSKNKPQLDYRSAKAGRFVTEGFAKRHPSTTVHEINPAPKPSGGGKK